MSLALQKIPRISLSCKLVPVLYRECRCGLFSPLEVPACIHGSCIYHLGLDICFDNKGNGNEARQTSKGTKTARFMLEGPRPCTIFCFVHTICMNSLQVHLLQPIGHWPFAVFQIIVFLHCIEILLILFEQLPCTCV